MNPSATALDDELSPWIVAISASGPEGLDDIKALLAALPANLAAAVLVALHRPSDDSSKLGVVLSRASRMPVLIAADGERLRIGHCYIGEPDGHLSLASESIARLVEGANHKHRGHTVDILFNSVAAHAKKHNGGRLVRDRRTGKRAASAAWDGIRDAGAPRAAATGGPSRWRTARPRR
jgi:chemotaxis response regulator CheB